MSIFFLSSFRVTWLRSFVVLGLVLICCLFSSLSEARMGGGGSMGSRGSRTYSAPPPTSTAPRSAAPIERSMTTPSSPSSNTGLFRPAPAAASSGFFGSGFGRGLMGGLLGAGIFGLLFGHGLSGGLGGGMSMIGLIIQLALLFFVGRFLLRRFMPAFSGAGTSYRSETPASESPQQWHTGSSSHHEDSTPLTLDSLDFSRFEQLLSQIQDAFSAEDFDRIRKLVTPEMASYFSQQITDNVRKGVINKISAVHLLKGDLSEAWQEDHTDYATVAMRFSLIDATFERTTNRLVEGDDHVAQEVTEIWTFKREAGSRPNDWLLSAIQQTT